MTQLSSTELREATWIVIAALNEAAVIGRTIDDVLKHYPNVVVIDDGSSDETLAVARSRGAWTVRHPINLGQGAALQTGIKFALQHNASYIVTFDADGQHLAEDVALLITALETSSADIACGSRFLGRAIDLPRTRRLALKAAIGFTRLSTGLPVTDAHNGLRAMTARCGQILQLRQNRMAHASEILDLIASHDMKLVEVPTTVVYTPYSLRKGQKLSGALQIIVDLITRRLFR